MSLSQLIAIALGQDDNIDDSEDTRIMRRWAYRNSRVRNNLIERQNIRTNEQIIKYNLIITSEECSICLVNQNEMINTECNHIYCKQCIDTWFNNHNTCPQCRNIL